MDATTVEVIRDWLDAHWQDVLDYYGAKMQHMSQQEPVDFSDRTDYLLGNRVQDGVDKIVRINPQNFVEAISHLDEEVRQRCIAAAEEAERQARNASSAASTATSQGNTAQLQGNTAASQGTAAEQKGNTAQSQGNTAESYGTYAKQQGDRAKGYNDHPWEIRSDGYIYVWNESTQAMKKTNKMIIDFSDLTEAQRQAIAQSFYDTLVIASVQTCEDIVTELT